MYRQGARAVRGVIRVQRLILGACMALAIGCSGVSVREETWLRRGLLVPRQVALRPLDFSQSPTEVGSNNLFSVRFRAGLQAELKQPLYTAYTTPWQGLQIAAYVVELERDPAIVDPGTDSVEMLVRLIDGPSGALIYEGRWRSERRHAILSRGDEHLGACFYDLGRAAGRLVSRARP